tara:strand:- start:2313 stop:3824 length:1512 start_codon:yes stop_codon:yes gene_type:complete
MNNVKVIYGPPGTGKTTTLLNIVEKHLADGINPETIGYFSFTTRAADEASNRAAKKFNLTEDDIPYIGRTLHSIAYEHLSLSGKQVFKNKHLKRLGDEIGFNLGVTTQMSRENEILLSTNNEIMKHIDLHRARMIDLRTHWDMYAVDIDWLTVKHVYQCYVDYKKHHKPALLDFTDMIYKFIEHEKCPNFNLLCIDEAQDLSLLQHKMLDKLIANSRKVFLAGDDDQAIFGWAGADVKSFNKLAKNFSILKQSYRVPKEIHKLACQITARIKHRQKKTWYPTKETGKITYHRNTSSLVFDNGQWLVLARTNYLLDEIEDQLRESGIYYERKGHRGVKKSVLEAVYAWEDLRKGEKLTCSEIKDAYQFLKINSGVKYGYKGLKKADEETKYSIEDLKKNFGLLRDDIWHDALELIDPEDRVYLRSCRRKGEKLKAKPRVNLETIHGSKGGECQNVVIMTDLPTKADDEYIHNPDDECRVFYTGVTRAKEHLHIITPQTDRYFNL